MDIFDFSSLVDIKFNSTFYEPLIISLTAMIETKWSVSINQIGTRNEGFLD